MKKITLFFFVVTFFVWHTNAQFNEGFEDGIPSSWTVINGGDTNTWVAGTPGVGIAHTGSNVAKIVYNSTVAHDDYLITPQVTVAVGSADRITFWYKHRSNTFPEIFDVLLSTGGNTAPDFTVSLATAVTPTTDWQEMVFDLSAYEGQSVYIAFHSTTTNEYELNLDDIVVDSQPTDVLDYYNLQYPATGSIGAGENFNVYAQAYEAGLTDVTTGQAPGIESWIGYSSVDTDPSGSGWSWFPANFNVEVGNNDEYSLDLGTKINSAGTFYYASRWRLNGGIYTYGGIQADESYGGVWGEDSNGSGVLNVSGPVNDECSGAVTLTVNADYSCAVVTAGTTLGATASPQPDDAVGTPNNDVWFYFVATGASHMISLSDIVNLGGGTSTSTDMAMSVFNDLAGCDMVAANEVGESDPNSFILSGLTAGSGYFIRVYSYGTAIQNNSFNICIGTPPPPPANDDCSGAIALTPGTTFAENPVDGTVGGATLNGETNGCGSNGPGVWYSVVVPDDGNIMIEVGPDLATANTEFDSVFEAFTGVCGTLTSIGCNDDGADTFGFSLLSLTGQTPGDTLYIRVWEYGGNEFEPFSVSAHSPTLGVEEFTNYNTFTYFPNPVKNELVLKAQSTIQNVSIYNMLGQEVLRKAPNTLESNMNVSELQTGAYFVKITINDTVKTIRIIKQ